MTDEPREGARSEEEEEPISGPTQGEEPDEEWASTIPPEVVEQLVRTMRASMPDFGKMIQAQVQALSPGLGPSIQSQLAQVTQIAKVSDDLHRSLANIAAAMQPSLTNRVQLIDFGAIAKPLLADISALMPKILPPDLGKSLGGLLQQIKDKTPPNWPKVDYGLVFKVIQEEGIPLVWVPRAEVVAELLDAADREARIKVLTTRCSDVVEDCREALAQVIVPDLDPQMPLALNALDAYATGHFESAQALAVVVVETAVTRLIGDYATAKKAVQIDDPKELALVELRFRAALAPIGSFYVGWKPSWGVPMPETLSRHVTVHQAVPAHYTHGNATVAIMLLASVFRGLQEFLDLTKPTPGQP